MKKVTMMVMTRFRNIPGTEAASEEMALIALMEILETALPREPVTSREISSRTATAEGSSADSATSSWEKRSISRGSSMVL